MGHNPATPATARLNSLELTIASSGTMLRVVLCNVGEAPLKLQGPVSGPDRRHFDPLRAEVVLGGQRRTLRFTGDRDTSEVGVVDLAPGGQLAEDLDLAAWAMQPINDGRALASGDHAVSVTYELKQPGMWSGSVTAGPVTVHVR